MPVLSFRVRLRRPPEEVVAACFSTPAAFERLLPRYLARVRVAYGPGEEVAPGTVVEFRPWLFPRRWRVVSHLQHRDSGRWVWEWREGPLRGTETWRFDREGDGGTLYQRVVEYHTAGLRERSFWWLVAIPAHTLVAAMEERRLRRWARGAAETF